MILHAISDRGQAAIRSMFNVTDEGAIKPFAIALLRRSFSLATDHRKRMTALASGLAGG